MSAVSSARPRAARTGVLRGAGLSLLCLALVAVFAVAVFPYERFRRPAARLLGDATGAAAEIGSLEGGLGLLGPRLTARPLHLRWPDGSELAFAQARLRPALSLSWLRGRPAFAVALAGAAGELDGTLWPGRDGGFRGRGRGLDLAVLPLVAWLGAGPDAGIADAEVDLRIAGGEPTGELHFEARDGSLALPEIGFALPYASLSGEARFAEGGALELSELALDGPALALTGGGTLGAAPRSELDLDLTLQVVDPGLRPLVESWGVRLDRAGQARLRVGGTAAQPIVR